MCATVEAAPQIFIATTSLASTGRMLSRWSMRCPARYEILGRQFLALRATSSYSMASHILLVATVTLDSWSACPRHYRQALQNQIMILFVSLLVAFDRRHHSKLAWSLEDLQLHILRI